MTPYEVIYTMNEFETYITNNMFGYFSIISAFLVVSYLVAHRLNRLMIVILMLLYTVVSFAMWMTVSTKVSDLRHLASYGRQAFEDTHPEILMLPMINDGSIAAYGAMSAQITIILAGGYISSVAFFLIVRRTRLKKGRDSL